MRGEDNKEIVPRKLSKSDSIYIPDMTGEDLPIRNFPYGIPEWHINHFNRNIGQSANKHFYVFPKYELDKFYRGYIPKIPLTSRTKYLPATYVKNYDEIDPFVKYHRDFIKLLLRNHSEF